MKLFPEYRGFRKELYILFIGRMMTAMGQMVMPMLTLILSQKLGMSAANIALVFLVYSLVTIPVNLFSGKLADHFNKRNLIIIFDLASVAIFISCSFLELKLSTVVLFAAGSLFQNAEGPAYEALIADFTTPENRSGAYSLSYLGMNLGLVMAPTIGGILFNNHLNIAFLINGLAVLSSTILIFFMIKDIHVEKSNSDSGYEEAVDDSVSGFKYIFSNRVLLSYMIERIFEEAAYSMYFYMMPMDLGIVHGEAGSVIYGTVSSLNSIVVVAFTALLTRLVSKKAEMTKSIYGEICELVGLFIFIIGLRYVILCYVAIFIFTLGEILCTISSTPFLTKRIPSSHRGRIISVIMVTAGLGQSLLQNGVGKVHDVFGMNTAWAVILGLGSISLALKCYIRRIDRVDYEKLY